MVSGGKSNSAGRALLDRPMLHPRRKRRRRHIDRPPSLVRRKIRIPLEIPLHSTHTYPERIRHHLFPDEPVTQRNNLRPLALAGAAECPQHTFPGRPPGSPPTASPTGTPPCTRNGRTSRRGPRCQRSTAGARWRSRT